MFLLEEIGIITGICSALGAGGYFVVNMIQKRRVRYREKINAKWVNAGEVSFDMLETHNLELDLEVDLEDGEIVGILKSIRIDGKSISPLCSVVGKLGFRSSRIQIWYSRFGEGILYGEADISLKKKVIIWKLRKGTADFFPMQTILYKQPKS